MFKLLSKYGKHFILLAVASAIVCGVLFPYLFDSIQVLGSLFLNLLKLFALPLISSALVSALGGLSGSLSTLKSLSRKWMSYMLCSEVMAVVIALVLFNLLQPGVGGNRALISDEPVQVVGSSQQVDWAQGLLSIVPDNIFHALANFELLPVVIFSILFGLGCAALGKLSQPIIDVATAVREVSSRCLSGVMLFAPIGIFALVGKGVAESHLKGHLQKSLLSLLSFVGVLVMGLLLHALWQVIVASLVSRQKITTLLAQSASVFSTAFGTSSSVATLPVAMECADRLKSNPLVTRSMLPLCAAINVGGMMMYEMAAALFFAQLLGLDLSLSQQVVLAIACILGGMAEGGIPETSMVSLVVVFRIVNIPLSAISFLLPLDRIIDRLRTMVNIFGNMCGVITVSQWMEREQLRRGTQKASAVSREIS